MADNLKMALEGTQFSDGTVSIAWGSGRDESEVIAVPPAQRGSKLLSAIAAGTVVETDDDVTEAPAPAENAYWRYHGVPTDGQVPVYVEENDRYEPGDVESGAAHPDLATHEGLGLVSEDDLDDALSSILESGLFSVTIASWLDDADLTTPEGKTFTNVTRSATGGPNSNGPYLADANGGGAYQDYLALTGLAVGTRVRTTLKAKSFSGGGTYVRMRVESGSSYPNGGAELSGSWAQHSVTVTVGSDGLYFLEGVYSTGIADVVVEILPPVQTRAINVIFDGAGEVIEAGRTYRVEVPFAWTDIASWRVVADASGTISVDVKKATYAGLPTTTSIAASAKPAISGAQKAENTTLTGWTKTGSSGDWLEFVVEATPATVTAVTVSLVLII